MGPPRTRYRLTDQWEEISDEDAKKKYPQGWREEKPYLRFVPDPTK